MNILKEPYLINPGVYGATFNRNDEDQLLTETNAKCWSHFKDMNRWVANGDSRGILSGLVSLAGKVSYPKHEDVKEATGFTEDEYTQFTEKAISLKKKTNDKIVELLKANSVGIGHMYTGFRPNDQRYIVYISKNPNFSIQNFDITNKNFSLKAYIESYSDILITVGTDFSEGVSFYNRGISRNPYWVFEEKYSGLSMLLHGFCAVVADKYFPEKKMMTVKPVGSMQCIIKKNLLPGEGYTEFQGVRTDITTLEVESDDPEGELNHITIAALKRIYQATS